MANNRFRYIALLTVLYWGLCASANGIREQIMEELAQSRTAQDSIKALFNLYDIAPYSERMAAVEHIYDFAEKNDDQKNMFEAMRLMVSIYEGNDSLQYILHKRIGNLKDANLKQSLSSYARIRFNSHSIKMLPEDVRLKNRLEYIAYYKHPDSSNIYGQIEYLFYLCSFLHGSDEGNLMINYLHQLQELIDKLPPRDMPIIAMFYIYASDFYFNSGRLEDAVRANRKVLETNKEFDRIHKSEGRRYRNYDGTSYSAYHKLLRCYSILSLDEIEEYYSKLIEITNRNSKYKENTELRTNTEIYYLLAKMQYARAIPLILQQLKSVKRIDERQLLAKSLIKAARAINDKNTLLKALTLYADILQERIATNAKVNDKELQILGEINTLKQENNDLISKTRENDLKQHKRFVIYSIIILIVVIALLIIVFELYCKARKLADKLTKSNQMLINERDTLSRAQKELIDAHDKAKEANRIKTDFVNNVSHEIRTPLAVINEYSTLVADCAEENRKPYIRKFAEIISLNTDLLLTLVNDVLDLPSLENTKMTVHYESASVLSVCRFSIQSVSKHVAPRVSLVFDNDNDPDVIIRTDPRRLEQVLLNMLMNAAKFTESGKINLAYQLSDDKTKITFSVTDTGIGIPRGKEEVIFSRFDKLNSETQGNGLGLYICRLIADLLKGEIKVDADYRKGARFLFTIPIN